MAYRTLRVRAEPHALWVTLDRPERSNGITGALLAELHAALDEAEARPDCRLVVIEGAPGVFCTGMDFADTAGGGAGGGEGDPAAVAERGGTEFLGLLKRLTAVTVAVVALVDGRAAGGGVGIAAASDLVYATPRSTFSLPEALWGLLPCCVLPFLIRRVGFQLAYAMSLSTMPVSAERAHASHLVDHLSEEPVRLVHRLRMRLAKLDGRTIADLKRYVRPMWELPAERERAAVAEFARLMSAPAVRGRIDGFVTAQTPPWQTPPWQTPMWEPGR